MPGRPSDPLLAFLRDTLRRRQLTTAALAARTGLDRAALKHKLAGQADLSIDEFILLSQALELSPEQLGLAPSAPAAEAGPRLVVADEPAEEPEADEDGWEPDSMGNLPRQAMRLGFALGIDLFVLFDSRQLKSSGVPPKVLAQFPDQLPIKLDARYHADNEPVFGEDNFRCVLSFDALYTCTFPWSAFRQISFQLPQEEPAPPPEPKRPSGPVLRVIK